MCFEKIGYSIAKNMFRRQHQKACRTLCVSHIVVFGAGVATAIWACKSGVLARMESCFCQKKKAYQTAYCDCDPCNCTPCECDPCDGDGCDCDPCADDGECDPRKDEAEGKRPPECEGIATAEGKIGDNEAVTESAAEDVHRKERKNDSQTKKKP